jgi:ammonia channel protein AmtB
MDQQALVEAIVGARSQIDFVWQFFVSAQLAVFALLIIYDHVMDELNFFAKFLVLLAIGTFDWINAGALMTSYQLLDALHDQYRASFGNLPGLTRAFKTFFVNARYDTGPETVMFTHSLAFSAVLLTIVWQGFIRRRPKPEADGQA